MRGLTLFLLCHGAVALPGDGPEQTAEACLAEFQRCRQFCETRADAVPHERTCVTSCAKISALCQHDLNAMTSVPAHATTGLISNSTFAFTDVNGDRFLPFGFYQYSVTRDLDKALPGEEAVHGMTLSSPYASTAAPDAAWFASMDAFLDSAAAAGFRVNFQLIGFESKGNDAATLKNLTAQILHFKDHPAIMAWYLADEPGGQGIRNTTLLPKYEAIRAADPSGRPVSMVFCTTQAANYLEMLDVIMVDPYPVPGASAASVLGALNNVASLGKPVMMVPQAFGGGENWARAPSRQEERLMTYLGLLSGAKAIQYFVRSPEATFPYAPAAWGEIREIAEEVRVLTPALLGGQPAAASVTLGTTGKTAAGIVVARAWVDRDGSVVVVAANTANDDGPPISLQFTVQSPAAAAGPSPPCTVLSMFENRFADKAPASDGRGALVFSDSLRGFGTAAYRLECGGAAAMAAQQQDNMVYNGGYEITVNPAVPDGNYLSQPSEQGRGGFFFAEYRDSVKGRASLRLTAPAAGQGVTLSPYTVPRVTAGQKYTFSVWIKGLGGGVTFAFNHNIFSWKDGKTGQPTSTLSLRGTSKWTQATVTLTATSDPATACMYGCRGWVSYTHTTKGDVWLDELTLKAD